MHTFLTSYDKSHNVPHQEKSVSLVSFPSYSYRTLILTQHPHPGLKMKPCFKSIEWPYWLAVITLTALCKGRTETPHKLKFLSFVFDAEYQWSDSLAGMFSSPLKMLNITFFKSSSPCPTTPPKSQDFLKLAGRLIFLSISRRKTTKQGSFCPLVRKHSTENSHQTPDPATVQDSCRKLKKQLNFAGQIMVSTSAT